MKKKMIFIILIVAILLIIIGIYTNKNQNEKKSENISIANDTNYNSINDNEEISVNEINENNIVQNESIEKAESENKEKDSIKNNNISTEISKQLTPSGFMGSSLYKVTLYSNGEVYVITYNGEGYEDKDIVDKKLIAQNAKSIEQDESEENYGGIIVKGGESINRNFGWISFK